jgi:hypothetical protein
MRYRTTLLSVVVILLGIIFFGAAETARDQAKPVPSMSEIKQTVLRHFQAKPDYRSGDLIMWGEVDSLLGKLQKQRGYRWPTPS